jgi:hypothetical protein
VKDAERQENNALFLHLCQPKKAKYLANVISLGPDVTVTAVTAYSNLTREKVCTCQTYGMARTFCLRDDDVYATASNMPVCKAVLICLFRAAHCTNHLLCLIEVLISTFRKARATTRKFVELGGWVDGGGTGCSFLLQAQTNVTLKLGIPATQYQTRTAYTSKWTTGRGKC